jgi:hypothetical protein
MELMRRAEQASRPSHWRPKQPLRSKQKVGLVKVSRSLWQQLEKLVQPSVFRLYAKQKIFKTYLQMALSQGFSRMNAKLFSWSSLNWARLKLAKAQSRTKQANDFIFCECVS